jgi:hypothetical protein
VDLVREAAGFEGLIVLAVIYFVLNALQKAGEKARRSRSPGAPPPGPSEPTPTQEEGFSLENVLREIERLKAEQEAKPLPPPPRQETAAPPKRERPLPARRQVPPPMRRQGLPAERGPMGRQAQRKLPPAEEVEVRETWDEQVPAEVAGSLENLDETRFRPPPVPVDQDDEAEAIAGARIRAAEMRNRPHLEVDHRSFHERVMQQAAKAPPPGVEAARKERERLRAAVIWREILGPPKAFEE